MILHLALKMRKKCNMEAWCFQNCSNAEKALLIVYCTYFWIFKICGKEIYDNVLTFGIFLILIFTINFLFFTHHQPNGRFEVGKKICLSISGYHPETWQPSWSIRTALLAIIGFMPTPSKGTIGSLDYSAEERKKLAKKSLSYVCPDCGLVAELLKSQNTSTEDSITSTAEEAKEIIKTMSMKVYFFSKIEITFFILRGLSNIT